MFVGDQIKWTASALKHQFRVLGDGVRTYGVASTASAAVEALREHGDVEEVLRARHQDALELSSDARLATDPAFACEPNGLRFTPSADQHGIVGGHNPKQVMVDQTGAEWLFKTAARGDEYRMLGEVAASQLFEEAGIATPRVFLTRQNLAGEARLGIMQPMIAKDPAGLPQDPRQLTLTQRNQLLRAHVGRWLLADHDTKAENFLVTRGDAQLQPIDFGNLYRYFPNDSLDRFYQEFPSTSYTNRVWQANVHGLLDLDFTAGLDQAHEFAAIPDERFKEILRPFADAWYRQGEHLPPYPSAEAFLDAAVARKNALPDQVQAFYRSMDQERAANLPPAR